MTEQTARPAQGEGNGPVLIRVLLALICLVPGVIGLLLLAVVAGAFVFQGFHFPEQDLDLMQIFVIASAMLIAPSIILLGIILRYARWQRAPTASLVLAVTYVVADIVGAGLLERTLKHGDMDGWQMLLFWSGLGLLIGALPPFLHWWNSKG